MTREPYLGAILAAGKGTRMAPLCDTLPKPLLPVANKPLMQYQIEMMRDIGINDIVLVIGHHGHEIAREFGNGASLGVKLRYVEQNEALGIAHAIGKLEPFVNRPFAVALGDIFFEMLEFDDMFRRFEAQSGGAVLAVKQEPDLAAIRKNFSIALDTHGLVRRVVEKPRVPENNLKGVGLYLFDESVFDAIRLTPRTAMRNEYEITHAVQIMIDGGRPVGASECVKEDFNVTSPRDLLDCNLRLARKNPGGSVDAGDTVLAPGARIENSVVGSGVTVVQPITISNSVVFANCEIFDDSDIHWSIITPERLVDCQHHGQRAVGHR